MTYRHCKVPTKKKNHENGCKFNEVVICNFGRFIANDKKLTQAGANTFTLISPVPIQNGQEKGWFTHFLNVSFWMVITQSVILHYREMYISEKITSDKFRLLVEE